MKRTVLFLALIAASVGISYSQNNFDNQIAETSGSNTGLTRPRYTDDDKSAAVKASVMVNTASVERTVFDLINAKRAENGLKPLIWSDDVAAIARKHSQNMAEYTFFSHRGIDGTMVSGRADSVGLKKWRSIGENIAFNRGYADPIEKAIQLWMGSASHRHNLLSTDWQESAVGVAVAEDGSYYFTQVFLLRK